ncbi:cytochrome oxidase assembly [Apodospora peruviana]|uniref:Cytochrome oxidase assembly n=1 Tax=Apodospora peruviana TaxID=516989 RepID=A0AAE0M0Z7_9PEZI|nr:cytochrome oxidase assembly [Apodospora peruviana]
MLSRIARHPKGVVWAIESSSYSSALLRRRILANTVLSQSRTVTSAPKPGDGPLMERRADRELPDIDTQRFRWARTLPIFALLIAAASVAIFNYQKSSSPVVSSTLYALRTSPKARDLLGENIYFEQQIPWISGEMNQLHGRINVSFRVKGTKSTGVMRFASTRPSPRGVFETLEWSLEMPDGRRTDLLEDEGDPFKGIAGPSGQTVGGMDEEEEVTRGFRKMPNGK